jgi:predicted DNA-binding transcriptional regulator AlpA
LEQWRLTKAAQYGLWDITVSHGAQTMTLQPDTNVLRSIFGLNTPSAISSITLPASALLSRDALLSYRDCFRVWIVRERLSNPGSEKLLLRLPLKTKDGMVTLNELVSSSTSAPSLCTSSDMEHQTLGIKELAELLHRAPSTIASEVTKAPHKLPPRLKLPGSRKVLWLAKDVQEWLNEFRTN